MGRDTSMPPEDVTGQALSVLQRSAPSGRHPYEVLDVLAQATLRSQVRLHLPWVAVAFMSVNLLSPPLADRVAQLRGKVLLYPPDRNYRAAPGCGRCVFCVAWQLHSRLVTTHPDHVFRAVVFAAQRLADSWPPPLDALAFLLPYLPLADPAGALKAISTAAHKIAQVARDTYQSDEEHGLQ